MIKIQDSLCLYACKFNIYQLSPEEWLQLKKLVTILQPFEEITRNMSDNNTSISSVIPLIHTLKHTLLTEGSKHDTNEKFNKMYLQPIKFKIWRPSIKHFFTIATYLDPRYKTNIETELLSLLDDTEYTDTSKSEGQNIDVPVEKRARMELPSEATHSNVQTVLSNILLSSDEDVDINTSENGGVFFFNLKPLKLF